VPAARGARTQHARGSGGSGARKAGVDRRGSHAITPITLILFSPFSATITRFSPLLSPLPLFRHFSPPHTPHFWFYFASPYYAIHAAIDSRCAAAMPSFSLRRHFLYDFRRRSIILPCHAIFIFAADFSPPLSDISIFCYFHFRRAPRAPPLHDYCRLFRY